MSLAAKTVDPEEIERFSRIAEEWWDEKGKFRPLHHINPLRLGYIRDQACAHLGRNPEKRDSFSGLKLLDIGCGGGLLCEPLTRLGAKVTGIDASQKNIAVASLHAEKMGLEIEYVATTPEAMTAKNSETFDIVLALEVIEHVADVTAFLHACSAVVKPGGLLFISTLNRTIKSYALAIVGAEYVLRWLPRGTHSWQKFLKPSELCSAVRKEGINIVHMTGLVFDPFRDNWSLKESDIAVNYMITAGKPA